MLKMIFFDEDPDEVLKEEDISADVNSGVERIDFRDTEEVGTKRMSGQIRSPNFHQSDFCCYNDVMFLRYHLNKTIIQQPLLIFWCIDLG